MTDPSNPSAQRIWDRCEALAACSEQADGLTRVFLSDQHRAAAALVLDWMRAAGMSARLDEIGNCVGRYEGARAGAACLLLGSHLDTVRDAGKYDGMLGVVSAIDCVHALHARGRRLAHAIEVVGFADEEGVRFGCTLLGSRALAGSFDAALLDRTDRDGITMRAALTAFGLDPARIPAAARRRDDVLAYLELHIEQGPVLEAEGLALGVVTAINGASRFQVDIDGLAGHAGTVPMTLRHDALAAAAECVLAIEKRCAAVPELVGTVGRLEASPGATNVIPGKARFTIDIRAPRDAERLAAANDVQSLLHLICARRRVKLTFTQTHDSRTAACAPWLMQQIGAAIEAEAVGEAQANAAAAARPVPVRQLPSGAGHDGLAMVDLTDIGMLFVRCKGGISHNPAEAITLDDAGAGARALLRCVENFQPAGALRDRR